MSNRILRFIAATLFLVVATHAMALPPPSEKKIILDIRELIEADLATNRRIQGLIDLKSVTVLSKQAVTEDRFAAKVRLVRVRNSRPLPRPDAVGYTYQSVQIFSRMPAGVKLVEVEEVMYRLRQGEWRLESHRNLKTDGNEFQLAYKRAEQQLLNEQLARERLERTNGQPMR
jgi:hypothetical protein